MSTIITISTTQPAPTPRGVTIQSCEIIANTQIDEIRIDMPHAIPQIVKAIPVIKGYGASFIVWQHAAAHAVVGSLHVTLVNLGNAIGCLVYSHSRQFSISATQQEQVIHTEQCIVVDGVYHAFAVVNRHAVKIEAM